MNIDDKLLLILKSKEKDQVILEDLKCTPLISKSPNTDLKWNELKNFAVRKYIQMVQHSKVKDITQSSHLILSSQRHI